VKVDSYDIHVEFFPEDAEMYGRQVPNDAFMRGNATVEFSNIADSSVSFYLHGELKIDSIVADKKSIEYGTKKVFYQEDYSGIGLKTTFNTSELIQGKPLQIYYSGYMNPSKVRSLSNYMHINKNRGVFLRAYRYSIWFPVFVEPGFESYEANFKNVIVTLPKDYRCVVSGELLSEDLTDDHYIASWRPGVTNLFNVQCSARKYNLITHKEVSVYHVGTQLIAEGIIDFTEDLKKIYQQYYRNSHSSSALFIIELPEFGNISSQNVIGLSSNVYNNFNNSLSSKLTIAHELVHPYVQIPISKDNPFASLVIEGFPSFFHMYALKKLNPDFEFHKIMERKEKRYLSNKKTGTDNRGNPLPEEKPILEIPFEEIGNYKDNFILSDRVPLFLYHLYKIYSSIQGNAAHLVKH
jgi:hypothetical protein